MTATLIQPYAVIEEINKHTKGEAIISTGVGQHQMWAAQYFDYREPQPVADFRQHGNDGFWTACSDRRTVREGRTVLSSTSMVTPACA